MDPLNSCMSVYLDSWTSNESPMGSFRLVMDLETK